MTKAFYFVFIFLSVLLIGELFWLLEKLLFVKYNLESTNMSNYIYSLLDEFSFIIICHFLSCLVTLLVLFKITFQKSK